MKMRENQKDRGIQGTDKSMIVYATGSSVAGEKRETKLAWLGEGERGKGMDEMEALSLYSVL